jgi:hypothetical protein
MERYLYLSEYCALKNGNRVGLDGAAIPIPNPIIKVIPKPAAIPIVDLIGAPCWGEMLPQTRPISHWGLIGLSFLSVMLHHTRVVPRLLLFLHY